jgi:sorbitol-specific phosphotransferase system component IIC
MTMATIAAKTPVQTVGQFDVETSDRSLGRNLPQRIGRRLVLPMLAMAVMAFPAALIVGIVRASKISDGASPATVEELKHVGAGLMFLGFASVFAAISFAIARILGQFRTGGEVQEAAGRIVQTLRMPLTAKLFLGLMAMAMMTLLAAVALHFAFAADITNTPASLKLAEQRFVVLEGIRRAGIATYLLAIVLGLASIIQVLRFQAIRLRQLPTEAPRA